MDHDEGSTKGFCPAAHVPRLKSITMRGKPKAGILCRGNASLFFTNILTFSSFHS